MTTTSNTTTTTSTIDTQIRRDHADKCLSKEERMLNELNTTLTPGKITADGCSGRTNEKDDLSTKIISHDI